jgi:glycosyltransferase involved in cell wall biosynthesis
LFLTDIITRSNSSSDGWSKNKIKSILYKIFLKIPNDVIVNSYDFKKELDKKFNIKTIVIYNPLNKKEIIKKSKEKLNLKFFQTKKHLKLINIGRLVDQKDQLTILKALKIIKKKLNFKLLIVGSGTYKIKLEKFINKENMSHCVKIIPFQKNPFKFIKKADLFILSSKFEGLPNVLLEAQTLKKYIISTNCPTGPNEILSGGSLGDLVKVKDYKKLASKIMWFSKNKNKKIISKKIDASFKKLLRFDYNLNMKKYKQVVEKYIHY